VLTFRNSHGWVGGGYEAKVYGEAFRVLKLGGILGVVQHRAKEGADPKKTAGTGYVPEAYLIEAIEKIGFELVEKSEINANPKDTTDHLNGVWTLPPSLSVVKRKDGKDAEKISDEEKAKREAKSKEIGESDRMTLKFKKPE
jgi:predicted methyltransferase